MLLTTLGDELDDVRRDRDRALLGLGPEDRDPGLEVRRGEVRDQTPLEAAPEPLLERQDRLRRPIRAQDDLLAVLVDRVECVEELFLGPLLVGDELDVVDEEQVDPAVAGPELVDLALLDRGDELVRELLAGGIHHPLARELGDDLVADGVHQVGLAETHPAVQEQRVVGVPGSFGDGQAGGVGEPVGGPNDEVGEGVARVEVGRAALATDPAWFQPDLLVRSVGRSVPGRPVRRPGRAGDRRAVPRRRGFEGRLLLRLGPIRGRHDELDLDAVADDPRERLADQRSIAGLEPVLGEAVRDRDPEALLVHVDQLGVAQPRLVIGRGE
jgi:hypothetical protein